MRLHLLNCFVLHGIDLLLARDPAPKRKIELANRIAAAFLSETPVILIDVAALRQ